MTFNLKARVYEVQRAFGIVNANYL